MQASLVQAGLVFREWRYQNTIQDLSRECFRQTGNLRFNLSGAWKERTSYLWKIRWFVWPMPCFPRLPLHQWTHFLHCNGYSRSKLTKQAVKRQISRDKAQTWARWREKWNPACPETVFEHARACPHFSRQSLSVGDACYIRYDECQRCFLKHSKKISSSCCSFFVPMYYI